MTRLRNRDWSDKRWLVARRTTRLVILTDWLVGVSIAFALLFLYSVLG